MDKELRLEYVNELINKTEQELVDMWVNEWMYQKEVAKPTTIGREQAQQNLAIYQKRIKYLEEKIKIYQDYQTNAL